MLVATLADRASGYTTRITAWECLMGTGLWRAGMGVDMEVGKDEGEAEMDGETLEGRAIRGRSLRGGLRTAGWTAHEEVISSGITGWIVRGTGGHSIASVMVVGAMPAATAGSMAIRGQASVEGRASGLLRICADGWKRVRILTV